MKAPKRTIIAKLAAIKGLQDNPPAHFRPEDHARLGREFASLSSELVAIEINAYRKSVNGYSFVELVVALAGIGILIAVGIGAQAAGYMP